MSFENCFQMGSKGQLKIKHLNSRISLGQRNSNYQNLLQQKEHSFTNEWIPPNLLSTTTALHSLLMLICSSDKPVQIFPLRGWHCLWQDDKNQRTEQGAAGLGKYIDT